MHAYQLPTPDPKFTKRPRRSPRARQHPRRNPYRVVAVETTFKLAVNAFLSLIALVALAKLVPYLDAQKGKLEELDVAVRSTGDRVTVARHNFRQYFDPTQQKTLMQQVSNRIDPTQRQVVWQLPGTTPASATQKASR